MGVFVFRLIQWSLYLGQPSTALPLVFNRHLMVFYTERSKCVPSQNRSLTVVNNIYNRSNILTSFEKCQRFSPSLEVASLTVLVVLR